MVCEKQRPLSHQRGWIWVFGNTRHPAFATGTGLQGGCGDGLGLPQRRGGRNNCNKGLWTPNPAPVSGDCGRPELLVNHQKKKNKSEGLHRDSTSYKHTRAKKPNSDVTGGGKLLNPSKPSPVPAGPSLAKPLEASEAPRGFFSHAEVGLQTSHPTASHGCAQSTAGDGILQQITRGP